MKIQKLLLIATLCLTTATVVACGSKSNEVGESSADITTEESASTEETSANQDPDSIEEASASQDADSTEEASADQDTDSTTTDFDINAKVETKEDFIAKWDSKLDNIEDWTKEEIQQYNLDSSDILYNRTQEEKVADHDADGVVGYDVKYEEDTGLTYLVDLITGREYHWGDILPDGGMYDGQSYCREDVLKTYKYYNPDTKRSDDDICAFYGL